MKKHIKYPFYAAIVPALLINAVPGNFSLALPNVGEAPEMDIPTTRDKVERGIYLDYHVMMCADCHSGKDLCLFSSPLTPRTDIEGGDRYNNQPKLIIQ